MELKKKVIIEEITEYLPYDHILSEEEKTEFLDFIINDSKISNSWMKLLYDYFYSHILDDGEIVSLSSYLKLNDISDDLIKYYKDVDNKFTDKLFGDNKPLFFFDVDNTLTDNAYLSSEKINYISNFDEKERIILSTGKTYESIFNVIEECKLEESYASSLNGSVVTYGKKFENINKVGFISEEISKKIKAVGINYIFYYNDLILTNIKLNEKIIYELKKYNEWPISQCDNPKYDEVIKILCFIYEGEVEKEELIRNIIKDYPEFVCMRTNVHTFEILRKDQHKGNTVKIISKRLGRYYRCSVGAGDSMNDLPMLNYVGKAYVVSTSNKELMTYNFEVLDENRDIDIVNLIKKYK